MYLRLKYMLAIVSIGFFISSFMNLQKPVAASLSITIQNLRNNKGHVLISLFKDGVGYPDEAAKAFKKLCLPIVSNKVIYQFTDLPTGQYAIAILHDENDDQKMNTNFFGIPKEGYGFSNNVMGTFGPPSFSKASFRFDNNSTLNLHIKAKY